MITEEITRCCCRTGWARGGGYVHTSILPDKMGIETHTHTRAHTGSRHNNSNSEPEDKHEVMEL